MSHSGGWVPRHKGTAVSVRAAFRKEERASPVGLAEDYRRGAVV
ncbi:hypothetical protein [Nostoc sp. LEGE 12450]|nr:hypothetical protein [Nostoc sp. LEGE 12450]